MAQPSSPSESLKADAKSEHRASISNEVKSDSDVPIDPSIAQQQSPTYPPYYSPHPQQGQDMSQYQGPPQHNMAYRPEWGYGQPPHMAPGQYPGHPVGAVPQGPPPPNAQRPGQVSLGITGSPRDRALITIQQVYSFVPIPGAQQHKRPRRRYEEIERMYKCGWNGCEKAYGTLNHLNAHVTMQAHGSKRTPEGTFTISHLVLSRWGCGGGSFAVVLHASALGWPCSSVKLAYQAVGTHD